MNNRRKRKVKVNYFRVFITLILLALTVFGIYFITSSCNDNKDTFTGKAENNISVAESSNANSEEQIDTTEPIEIIYPTVTYPKETDTTIDLPIDYNSKYAIIIDTETNEIIAQKDYNVRMYPASLTKVMSLIVAVENIDNLEDTYLITAEMIDPMIEAEASRAGFVAGETPTIKDLLYGMILPSGADATLALADYIAGSEAAFVEMMNEKAKEMGLKSTHFTNPVGLHDANHYSTAEDMALIMEYAIENELCKEVLSAYQYTIAPTEFNPEGLELTSTMFGRMDGTEMPGVVIQGGKTGYTDEAEHCLANFALINNKYYVMVLAGGASKWQTIYDTLSGYSVYCNGGEAYIPPQ